MDSVPLQRPPSSALAAALAGGGAPSSLADYLFGLGEELGGVRCVWLPRRGPAVGPSGKAAPLARRELDWAFLRELWPGEVRVVTPEERARSARLAVLRGWAAAVATSSGVEPVGALWLRARTPLALDDRQLAALADQTALVARSTRSALGEARRAREEELGRRSAGLLHDIRNQLTLAQLTAERAAEEPERRADLMAALRAARELCAAPLVPDGERPPLVPVRLRGPLVEEAQAALRTARGGPEGVGLRVGCPVELEALGELALVRRLARNLVLNALEASSPGDAVAVEARARDAGSVELEVRDEGRGLTELELQELMRPGASRSGGTGYGTTSLLHCVEELGGELRIDSAPGRGTRVRVLLQGTVARSLLVDPDPRRAARRRSRSARARSPM